MIALLPTLTATLSEAFEDTTSYLSGSLLRVDRSIGELLNAVAGIQTAIYVEELIPYSLKVLRKTT